MLFVALVAVAVLCTFAYVAGRSISAGAVPATTKPAPVAVAVAPPALAPAPPAKSVEVPASAKPRSLSLGATDVPAPRSGEVYLQIGAVERGFAEVLVVGLRTRGFPSVMAPSSSEKIFRVLIGPLNDAAAYARAKAEMETAGLNFFPRRYQVGSDPAAPAVKTSDGNR